MAKAEQVDFVAELQRALAEQQKSDGGDVTVYGIMDDWFNPKQELMKHVIVVQMIACILVATFLLSTAATSLSSEDMMYAVFTFMVFIAAAFGVYGRL